MLYDIKMHLPQIIDKMIVEDYRAGDVTKLENDKTVMLKLLAENNDFTRRIKMIDDEHERNHRLILGDLNDLQKKIELKAKDLDKNEKSYWETVIGEITRTVMSMSKDRVPVDLELEEDE